MDEPGRSRTGAEAGTRRFREKRDAILAAAAEAINEASAKGMTFADVARRVGLNTTSVTYYFKRKEDLAAACFEQTLGRLHAMLDVALAETTPEARVARYIGIHFARLARVRAGAEEAVATLSDLRATEEPARSRLLSGWREVFRKTRALWGEGGGRQASDVRGARAHHLLENTFWLPVWLPRYELDQYPRLEARLFDLLRHGMAPRGVRWEPELLPVASQRAEQGRGAFLLAATRLINELGYRGASVQRIASELNVTKGSFYHHLDAKDELVLGLLPALRRHRCRGSARSRRDRRHALAPAGEYGGDVIGSTVLRSRPAAAHDRNERPATRAAPRHR